MEKLTVTRVYVSDKNKEGVAFKDKNGKPYKKVAVQFDKYGEVWFSTLSFRDDDQVRLLQAGDEKTFVIEDGQYKNFKLPSRLDIVENRVTALEVALKTNKGLETKLKPALTSDGNPEPFPDEPPQDGISPEDIPF